MPPQSNTPGLREDERAHLASLGHRTTFATDMVVCLEGDPSGDVFLLESGSVRIVRTTLRGRELILATRRAGDLVGELSAFDGQPRSAAIIANESTSLITVAGDAFRHAVASRPQLAELFLRELALKLRAADERTLERDSDDARTRVIGRLVTLADGRANPGATRVTVPLRQADLAAWVGASRETVARVLSDLRAEGLVTTGRGTIEVLDLPALRRPSLH